MGARFKVLVVGRSRCRWANDAVADYVRRMRRHGGVEEIAVRAEPFRGEVEAVRQAEGERIRGQLGPRDALVVLDERGERLSSESFSEMLDEGRQRGTMVFALGGAYGHDPATRAAAWRVIRLSDLVLNHEVARVVLHEQIYRGIGIIEGSPYHH